MHQQPESEGVDISLSQLYQRHASRILLFLDRHTNSKEDAEDLLLEVFMAAVENRNWVGLAEREQLAWLQRVARNKLVDHYRKMKRRPTLNIDEFIEGLFEADDQGPEYQAMRQEDYLFVQQRVKQLPEQQQEVLRLRFGHGLRSREIGRMLHKSEGAIRIILSRTLNGLRNAYLQEQEGGQRHDGKQ